jgi:hypothetical protein
MSVVVEGLDLVDEGFLPVRLEVPAWSTHDAILMSIFDIAELSYTLEHSWVVMVLRAV